MRLISIPMWQAKFFAKGSEPAEPSVRRMLREGRLPGRKVGGTWYVDEHSFLADGDELVLRVLNNG